MDLTPSEKVEIANRIEEAVAGRHGGDRKSTDKILPLEQPQGKSATIAAKAVEITGRSYFAGTSKISWMGALKIKNTL